jgi:hypothetical protein
VFVTDTRPLDLMAARSNSPLICGPRWLCERRICATPGIWARGQKKQRNISHARTHACVVSSSNALSSHAHGDPPTNPREREDFWPQSGSLHTHISRSLCKASIARPHATLVGTLSWEHFCKRLRSLCEMRLS